MYYLTCRNQAFMSNKGFYNFSYLFYYSFIKIYFVLMYLYNKYIYKYIIHNKFSHTYVKMRYANLSQPLDN